MHLLQRSYSKDQEIVETCLLSEDFWLMFINEITLELVGTLMHNTTFSQMTTGQCSSKKFVQNYLALVDS